MRGAYVEIVHFTSLMILLVWPESSDAFLASAFWPFITKSVFSLLRMLTNPSPSRNFPKAEIPPEKAMVGDWRDSLVQLSGPGRIITSEFYC